MELEQSTETPYGKIQLGNYSGQKSLFLNGHYVDSWPDYTSAEEKIHFFMSAISSPSKILILGIPNPDFLRELKKYSDTKIDVVEIDEILLKTITENSVSDKQVKFICEDPRKFINFTTEKYDGILILGGDPVYLADNRLFTFQAYDSISRILAKRGVFATTVSGCENYLGEEMQEVILSFDQTLKRVFPEVYAIPGERITFLASNEKDSFPKTPEGFIKNFMEKKIPTLSFSQFSIKNLMLQFRMDELHKWLAQKKEFSINSDVNPKSFSRQLQLWDIYSNSKLSGLIGFFSKMTLEKTLLIIIFCFLIANYAFWKFNWKLDVLVPSTCAGISGFISLLGEMCFIFLFQIREGAMHRMTAFFFGTFMLGLSFGAVIGHKFISNCRTEIFKKSLFLVKIFQGIFFLFFFIFSYRSDFHTLIFVATGIFTISFLAGFEFPIIEKILEKNKKRIYKKEFIASLLLITDNCGGVFGSLLSGIWLFPILGVSGTLAMCFVFSIGAAFSIHLHRDRIFNSN
ncbi:MAG: hypothetical protein HQM08_08335 [Candidatus Riflebacteria bacterium]|nr:hypothetical protein [Candidatus Riflebacteria bacterium]